MREWYLRDRGFFKSKWSNRPTKFHLSNPETGYSFCHLLIMNDEPGFTEVDKDSQCKRCLAAVTKHQAAKSTAEGGDK